MVVLSPAYLIDRQDQIDGHNYDYNCMKLIKKLFFLPIYMSPKEKKAVL